jgi:hypothetical protein
MDHTTVAIWLKMLALMRFVLLLMASISCHVLSVSMCIVVSSNIALFTNLGLVKYAALYALRILLLHDMQVNIFLKPPMIHYRFGKMNLLPLIPWQMIILLVIMQV